MYRFWDSLTLPILKAVKPHTIIEVGAWRGENTKRLWGFCRDNAASLHIIDPAPLFALEDICGKSRSEKIFLHKKMSLDVLPEICPFDVVLIDGDHNWYTVYQELKLLNKLTKKNKTLFPLMLFHDTSWPYARRDQYYNPEAIPEEFRQKHDRRGMLPGCLGLTNPGFNSSDNNAVCEGGARNGVLTAIEDFLNETKEMFHFYTIPAFHGYGIIISDARLKSCPALQEVLLSLLPAESVRLLIADLEKNRLDIQANFIKKGHLAEEYRRSLTALETQIQKLQQTVTLRDQAISQKEKIIAENEQTLRNANTAIEEKNQIAAKISDEVADKNKIIAENEQALCKANIAIEEKDQAIEKIQGQVSQKEEIIAQIHDEIFEKDKIIAQGEQTLCKANITVAEKNQIIEKMHSEISQRDKRLQETSKTLTDIKASMVRKNREIHHYRRELFSVYSSKSWRYMIPFRKIGSGGRRLVDILHQSKVRAVIKRVYYTLPGFLRNRQTIENLKNNFKDKETAD
ncbi:MAG: class I SAM-dependent methyltransferase [Phycisphaerae bacterium]|nr:class I SAM-dependent methyltransferase [Phycisphaerae bacterium]